MDGLRNHGLRCGGQICGGGAVCGPHGNCHDSSGAAVYDEFYPGNYPALHFLSPIITWGNGTGGNPQQVSTLLSRRGWRQGAGGAVNVSWLLEVFGPLLASPLGLPREICTCQP